MRVKVTMQSMQKLFITLMFNNWDLFESDYLRCTFAMTELISFVYFDQQTVWLLTNKNKANNTGCLYVHMTYVGRWQTSI